MNEERMKKDPATEDRMEESRMMEHRTKEGLKKEYPIIEDRMEEDRTKEKWTDELLSQKITEALDHLEATVSPPLPYLAEIKTLVARVKEEKCKKARKLTLIFMAVAVLLTGVEALAFSYSMAIFVTVQSIAVLAPMAAFIGKQIAKRQATAE